LPVTIIINKKQQIPFSKKLLPNKAVSPSIIQLTKILIKTTSTILPMYIMVVAQPLATSIMMGYPIFISPVMKYPTNCI